MAEFNEADYSAVSIGQKSAIEKIATKEIAVRYRQPGNVYIGGNPSGREYVATTQANISLAWVDPQDVDAILSKKGGCCGKRVKTFSLADLTHVRRWTNKGGR